jgi:hypothetical protein
MVLVKQREQFADRPVGSRGLFRARRMPKSHCKSNSNMDCNDRQPNCPHPSPRSKQQKTNYAGHGSFSNGAAK